jgi:hypothetical protein
MKQQYHEAYQLVRELQRGEYAVNFANMLVRLNNMQAIVRYAAIISYRDSFKSVPDIPAKYRLGYPEDIPF